MNILFVSNLFPPHMIGGYELACQDMAYALRDKGHTCHVLTSTYTDRSVVCTDAENLLVFRFLQLHTVWTDSGSSSSFASANKLNIDIFKLIYESGDYDIVYLWNLYGLGSSILEYCNLKEIPFVLHFMDLSVMAYDSRYPLFQNLLRRTDIQYSSIKRLCTKSIFVSHYLANHFKFANVDHIVSHPFIAYEDIGHKEEYVLLETIKCVYIGQLTSRKGICSACEWLHRIVPKMSMGISLDIYCPSEGEFGLIKKIESKYDFVTVHIGIRKEQVMESLCQYDIGIFPTLFDEPFGIAQIELMFAGLPVLSSGKGGSIEVAGVHNVLTYSPYIFESFEAQFIKLVHNYTSLGRNIGISAREYVKRFHSREIQVRHCELYLKMAATKNPSLNYL